MVALLLKIGQHGHGRMSQFDLRHQLMWFVTSFAPGLAAYEQLYLHLRQLIK